MTLNVHFQSGKHITSSLFYSNGYRCSESENMYDPGKFQHLGLYLFWLEHRCSLLVTLGNYLINKLIILKERSWGNRLSLCISILHTLLKFCKTENFIDRIFKCGGQFKHILCNIAVIYLFNLTYLQSYACIEIVPL